jgi:hypothetical protein
MRFSAVTTLCATPLALAATLQSGLAARGAVGLEVRSMEDSKSGKSGQSGHDTIIEEAQSVEEVVIIWTNQGAGAATSTVTDTVTVTDTSGAAVAAATHQVSRAWK